jgi:hypothetical protein
MVVQIAGLRRETLFIVDPAQHLGHEINMRRRFKRMGLSPSPYVLPSVSRIGIASQ